MNQQTLEKAAVWVAPALMMLVLVLIRPATLTDPLLLGGFIVAQIAAVSLWHYRATYFATTVLFFIFAGSSVPFEGLALTARWPVLGAGALIGAVIWLRSRVQSFTELHLAAFLCIPAAAASVIDSNDPFIALLKVASLFLLFLYGAMGARAAMAGREEAFFRGVLKGCEAIVFLTAFAYLGGWAFWGNPNSMGAITAVVLVPIMLWGFLIAQTRNEKYRRGIALLVCLILLYVALSRASLLAAAVSSVAMLFCLRRQKLLVEGAFGVVLVLAVIAVMAPANFDKFYRNLTTDIVYKGKKEQGLFGSRQSPWQETVSSLKLHPWFGTGFGTSSITKKGSLESVTAESGFYTPEGTNREHGNSYLAMAEYLGLLGMLPFLVLLGLIARMIVQVCRWMRATADANHFAIPLAMVLLAGLVHAFFEDWLLAVGYYICLFFWISAFLLDDLRPDRRPFRFAQASPAHPRAAAPAPGLAVPNQ